MNICGLDDIIGPPVETHLKGQTSAMFAEMCSFYFLVAKDSSINSYIFQRFEA